MAEIPTPDCPGCGELPWMVLDGGTQAFCGNSDGCSVLTWNPTLSAAENLANAQVIDLRLQDDEGKT